MSNPLSHLATHFRAQLHQKRDTAEATLEQMHAQTIGRIQPTLDRFYSEISTKMKELATTQGEPAKIPLSWLYEDKRLAQMKEQVMWEVDNFAAFARITAMQAVDWATGLGRQAADSFMRAVQDRLMPLMKPFLPNAASTLRDLFSSFGKDAAKGVGDALTLGLSLGQKPREMAAQITKVLDEPRWRSVTIMETETQRAFVDVLLDNYRSNAQVITGWLWNCRLSARSCAACIFLHGTIHPLTEVLEDHPRGQCFPTPYLASMNDVERGVDWFERQDDTTKRDILGSDVAWEAYKAGTSLEAFVGVRHDHGYSPMVYQKSVKQITGVK